MKPVSLARQQEQQQRPDLCPASTQEPLSDAVEQYLAEIRVIPLLSAQEEHQLALRIREGDQAAKQQFMKANLRLVVHLARQYDAPGRDLLDLIQDGTIGLMRAVERFDPHKGYKFSTYAYLWIRQAMRRGLEQTAHLIRLPASLSVRTGMLAQITQQLFEQQGAEPTHEQIAAQMGLSVSVLEQVQAATYQMLSLDKPVSGHDDTTLGEVIADPHTLSADDRLCQAEHERQAAERVAALLAGLTERERQVLLLRFGLDGAGEQRSFAEIGQALGLTRQRVHHVYVRAIEKLRQTAGSAACGARQQQQQA